MVEERIVSFSIAHPGLGPQRVSSELAREKWGGIVVSPNGVEGALPPRAEHPRQASRANLSGPEPGGSASTLPSGSVEDDTDHAVESDQLHSLKPGGLAVGYQRSRDQPGRQ